MSGTKSPTVAVTPLKEKELREFATCSCCKRLIGQCGGLGIFYLVTLERHGLNVPAINRQAALEVQVGAPFIAQAMGPNEDFTIPLGDKIRVMVCSSCSCSIASTPACLGEAYEESKKDEVPS